MKSTITILTAFLFFPMFGKAQAVLKPGKNLFETKWIREDSFQMTWYGLRDTIKIEIGEVSTQILFDRKNIVVITGVALKNAKSLWIDSAIAIRKTMQPLRHTSTNMQRDIVLHFGGVVTGSYVDKSKNTNYVINDTTHTAYFDSNLYPLLIGWLPLSEGYKRDLSIYDYNPTGNKGVLQAHITNVKSGTYRTLQAGVREVWVVTVKDDIGNNDKSFITYYFDKMSRQLWKQEINAEGRKMLMVRKEG